MSNLQEIRNSLERRKGKKMHLQITLQKAKETLKRHKRDLINHEKAREIIREVGISTQKQLSYHISDVSSLALEGIFDTPYELVLNFEERRNKTECDILFKDKGNLSNPMLANGGGIVDVAAFALRVASWSMKLPKPATLIILDEPFRFLSKDLHGRASEMIKQVSHKLGIQFIIITHEEMLGVHADKVFTVINRNGVSKVREVTQ